MINKTVKIGEKEIPMRASAASPRTYRQAFGGDLFIELQNLQEAYSKGEAVDLGVIENMAYLFAYQADNDIPNIDEWLDQFGITEIYEAMPQILELWNDSSKTNSKEKK